MRVQAAWVACCCRLRSDHLLWAAALAADRHRRRFPSAVVHLLRRPGSPGLARHHHCGRAHHRAALGPGWHWHWHWHWRRPRPVAVEIGDCAYHWPNLGWQRRRRRWSPHRTRVGMHAQQ
ncbi:hypothetical protein CAOG_009395 [Capsaspora owczarzaki ATCC 30864]|uniref:Uncharacterized protein n=1 Tax=Capsaspora owczarzaki (strain ATCC 30864) TaxID=595528 RepID=A0A0D2WJZ3_CAPO3|nr:hypothetical protein CAOG_009395 [Capsaspora owczarzaki ATCC 30864]